MEKKKYFIYHLKLSPIYTDITNWSEETRNTIQAHANFLDGLGKKGLLILAGRTDLNPGDKNLFGIAIVKASSLKEAKEILAHDPAVINKIQEAAVYPFNMAIEHFENIEEQKP